MDFLNAYDFSSEGGEANQEDNKTLIKASVLGLIFEKINGYKNGSFFTPGFITIYMCRETIRKAVVQKFNENKGWDCKDLDQLYNRIEDRKEANDITGYNFLVAASQSPYNSTQFERESGEYFNNILKGKEDAVKFIEYLKTYEINPYQYS